MHAKSIEAIILVFNEASVRYLVAGGLAVVAHGYLRFTADVDIVLDLDADNTRRAIEALRKLGYLSKLPVPMEDFTQEAKRRVWVDEKDAKVFPLFSDEHPSAGIDLFIQEPFDFDRAYNDAERFEVSPGVEATFVGLADLIEMKRQAGRPQDLADIAELEMLRKAREGEGGG